MLRENAGRALVLALTGVLALAASLRAAEGYRVRASVKPGWDWALPGGVRPVPYSGFVTWGGRRHSEMITVAGVKASWKELSPASGRFNWQPLIDRIKKCRAQGMRSGIHLKGVERPSVPDWIVKKYKVPVLDVIPLQQNQPWRLQIVPPWHQGVMREYNEFMNAFGKTGIARMEDVVYAYIHGVGPSRGEELWMRPVDAEDWQKKSGLTPDFYAACIKARLGAMLRAFKGVEYKLAWMAAGPIGPYTKQYRAYREKTTGMLERSLALGTGWRHGNIDFQHTSFSVPPLGITLTKEGYCVVDDTRPHFAERRYFGDENEEYGKGWEWRFGPYEQHAYRHRISTLRTLQLRMNFQYVSTETLKLNPDLNKYAQLTQGRLAEDSPDAWAYLRECCIRRGGKSLPVKNLERWLVQRDVPGHMSTPAERIDRKYRIWTDPPERQHDFDARRTDTAKGQRGLAFQLDKRFWPKPRPAMLKVTFTDRGKSRWYVEYTDGRGKPRRTASIDNVGGGQRRTATFSLSSIAAARGYPGGMDFRIVTEGPGDVVVTVVRLIKATWKEPALYRRRRG